MRDDKPARWVAMWPKTHERKPWQMPWTGAIQGDNYYHNGGLSYMDYNPESYTILKDYGELTIDEWDEAGGDAQWYRDFPPITSEPSEFDEMIEAWIAPWGDLYLCESQGHEALAERLVKHLGIKDSDHSLNRGGDLLVDRGWIRLYWDHLHYMQELSQRQLDTLWDLSSQVIEKRLLPYSVKLANEIRKLFDMPPIDMNPSAVSRDDSDLDDVDDEDELEDDVLGDIHDFQKHWLGFVPDECPTADEVVAKGELLATICEAVSRREEQDEPAPEPQPEPPRRRFQLREQPFVVVPIKFYRAHGEHGGVTSWGFADTTTTTAHDDDNNEMGRIEGRMGAFELCDKRRPYNHHYRAPHDEVWEAFQEALDKLDDQKINTPKET